MYAMNFIYNSVINKKKERFNVILEPLQAVIQIALLSFAPNDSKLNIYNNILFIQIPNWNQSILRTYYNDSKNDIFFLFNVFTRFTKFYQHLKLIIDPKDTQLNMFKLLQETATNGIDKLLQTYRHTENPAILHTLNLYKKIFNEEPTNPKIEQSVAETGHSKRKDRDKCLGANSTTNQTHIDNPVANPGAGVDIDAIFANITKLYSDSELFIIFNTIKLLLANPENFAPYCDGLNNILTPINTQIQKWIVDNIVY
uniref:Uncharacterized protein n=1 Tax=viral metagenome TaxID=1070528 RepID=A0A6C0HN99_9ZZZZ